jgi:hypothetical protein
MPNDNPTKESGFEKGSGKPVKVNPNDQIEIS